MKSSYKRNQLYNIKKLLHIKKLPFLLQRTYDNARCYLFLQTVGSSNIKVTALENENTRLKQEIKSQILRNEELEKKLEKLEKQSHTVQEDYETLMNIMNRARKLAVMDDEERSQTSFRMDRNGNLEKLQNKRMHITHPF